MNKIVSQLKGDKTIWAVIVLLAMVSFLPVYSASTNLVYTVGNGGTTFGILFKHFIHLSIGMVIVYFVHKLHFEKFKKYSIYWNVISNVNTSIYSIDGLCGKNFDKTKRINVHISRFTCENMVTSWCGFNLCITI